MMLLSLPVPLKSSTSRGDFRGPRALGLSKQLWRPSFVPLAVPRWPPSRAAAPCPFPQAWQVGGTQGEEWLLMLIYLRPEEAGSWLLGTASLQS